MSPPTVKGSMDPTLQLGYLLHHLSFVLDRQSDVVLQERFGIGFSQFKILLILRKKQGVQQRQIADALGQTEASVSRQIHLMRDDGLIGVGVSSENRREHHITLTAKGERLIDVGFEALNDYHKPVFDGLTSNRQQALLNMLSIMHDTVCSADKPGACQHSFSA